MLSEQGDKLSLALDIQTLCTTLLSSHFSYCLRSHIVTGPHCWCLAKLCGSPMQGHLLPFPSSDQIGPVS